MQNGFNAIVALVKQTISASKNQTFPIISNDCSLFSHQPNNSQFKQRFSTELSVHRIEIECDAFARVEQRQKWKKKRVKWSKVKCELMVSVLYEMYWTYTHKIIVNINYDIQTEANQVCKMYYGPGPLEVEISVDGI